MTDNKQIEVFVQKELNVLQNAVTGYDFSFKDQICFANNNQTTEAFGRNEFTPHATFNFYERYENKQGLIAETDMKSPGIAHVWATSGKSTSTISPFQSSLNLRPEDFVLLAGKNPLDTYNASWKVISRTNSSLVLASEQTEGAFTPFRMIMTLDPKHGYSPSRIQATGKIWAADYVIKGFQKQAMGWLPTRVTVTEHWYDLQIHRELTLAKVTPSVPVLSKVPNLSVVDYRLIGENPLTAQVENAERHQDPRITLYAWNGKLPNLYELKKLHQLQNPGESSPDPGKTSSASFTPFLGGMLCLVGGVWMFKRRG